MYLYIYIYKKFVFFSVPDHVRPRVCSLPEKPYNPRSGDELYRLRTFSITNKGGVVNCGDSIINRRSRSNTSVNSTTSKWILYFGYFFNLKIIFKLKMFYLKIKFCKTSWFYDDEK